MSLLWFNGSVVEEDSAWIPALDRGVIWGQGLFETFRAYGGRPWAVEAHLARLRTGAQLLDIPLPDDQVLVGAMDTVIAANDLSDCGTRITVTRGRGSADPHEEPDGDPNVLVMAWPLRDYSGFYTRGASLVTQPGGRALAHVKSISYAVSLAGRVAARRQGCDDALFVGPDDTVLETTGSNLFVVRGDELVTPPLADGVLPGVTRATLIEAVGGCREQTLHLGDLWTADEVVLTSTLREVYTVRSVDGRDTPQAGIAPRLREAFRALVLTGSAPPR